MADHSRLLFLFSIIIFNLFLFSHSHPIPSGAKDHEVGKKAKDEHEYTYRKRNEKGPGQWGDIKPEWQICKTGKSQSPIDIVTNDAKLLPSLGMLKRNYKPAPAALVNRRHDISVYWKGADAGGVEINGTFYKLLQCHWHTPSEHTINGKHYDMELHLVHTSPSGHLAVIGILYKLGRPHDSFLHQFMDEMETLDTELDLGEVNPTNIKFETSSYYRYEGSLTAPPCTQDILWTVIDKERTVTAEQLAALRDAVDHGFERNSRPTQPLNGRQVYLYNILV